MSHKTLTPQQVVDETERPLDLAVDPRAPLRLGARLFVPFTIIDAHDLGQISLQACDGRVFNASIRCLNESAVLPGYAQIVEGAGESRGEVEGAPPQAP